MVLNRKKNRGHDVDDFEVLQIILNDNPALKMRVLRRIKEIRGTDSSRYQDPKKNDSNDNKPKSL